MNREIRALDLKPSWKNARRSSSREPILPGLEPMMGSHIVKSKSQILLCQLNEMKLKKQAELEQLHKLADYIKQFKQRQDSGLKTISGKVIRNPDNTLSIKIGLEDGDKLRQNDQLRPSLSSNVQIDTTESENSRPNDNLQPRKSLFKNNTSRDSQSVLNEKQMMYKKKRLRIVSRKKEDSVKSIRRTSVDCIQKEKQIELIDILPEKKSVPVGDRCVQMSTDDATSFTIHGENGTYQLRITDAKEVSKTSAHATNRNNSPSIAQSMECKDIIYTTNEVEQRNDFLQRLNSEMTTNIPQIDAKTSCTRKKLKLKNKYLIRPRTRSHAISLGVPIDQNPARNTRTPTQHCEDNTKKMNMLKFRSASNKNPDSRVSPLVKCCQNKRKYLNTKKEVPLDKKKLYEEKSTAYKLNHILP